MAPFSIGNGVEQGGYICGPRLQARPLCKIDTLRHEEGVTLFGESSSDTTASSLDEENMSMNSSDDSIKDPMHSLDNVLLAEWEDKVREGLFNYSLSTCVTKLISGKVGFIAQLNEGRASKKRATEFKIDQVLQGFEPSKFNFTKADERECLFVFEGDRASPSFNVSNPALTASNMPNGTNYDSPHLVLINVSPIDHGHVLLVPCVLGCFPQRIETRFVQLALQLSASIDNSSFRLGYNSLGAFGTVNHLHFQGYFLEHRFPIEKANKCMLRYKPQVNLKVAGCACNHNEPRLYELDESAYPVRGLVIESQGCLRAVAHVLGDLCTKLQDANIPFNFLICDKGSRVFVYPQKFAERLCASQVPQDLLEMGVNPAVFEIGGHIVLKRQSDYDCITEKNAWRLLQLASLEAPEFAGVKAMVGVKNRVH